MARHLTLYDFRDLDFMAVAKDAANDQGELTTEDLAAALGFEEDRHAVGSRMAWMTRYGVFKKDERTGMYRFTRGGERILEANTQAADAPAFDEVPDGALVEVMAHVTSRYRHGDALTATLLRREFQFGTKPGSAAYQQRRRRRSRR